MKKITQIYFSIFLLFLSINLFSTTIYVDASATGNQDGSTWLDAFTTVTDAVTAATSGDKIYIAAGTYKEGTTIIINKNLTIQGGYPIGGGAQDINTSITILDGEDNYQIIDNLNSFTLNLNALTIQNGNDDTNGGGIYNKGILNLSSCTINNNTAAINGGGIFSIGLLSITNSTCKGNTASYGAGISNSGSTLTILNSIIKNNTVVNNGGGIFSSGTLNITNSFINSNNSIGSGSGIYNWGTFNLINSVISNNTSSRNGGGIYNPLGTATIINSIITNNTASLGDGIFNDIHGIVNIKNSIVYENDNDEYHNSNDSEDLTFEYSLVKGENPTGTGNIDATAVNFDPIFIDFNNSNYNLKNGSPLINAGLNSFNTESLDIVGNPRINNSTVDIGPYEYSNKYIIWTGTTDNDWFTITNWDTNTLPTVISDVIIPASLTNYPTASTAVTFNTLTIESGATFIPESSVTSIVTYKRNIPDTNWHLITSPVIGETYENLIVNHTFATGTGTNIGLGTYLNSGSTPWIYFSNSTIGTIYRSIGYAVKLQSATNISFTGTISGVPNRSANVGSRDGFVLTGNPHTAYIDTNLFLNYNSDALAENSIWLWNGSEYTAYNLINSIQIEPAEGFFIEVASLSGISFPNSNRSHQNSSSSKQETIPTIELFIENNENKKATKIFYVDGKTTGFDNGYDSKIYGGTDYDFAVFTELVSNNEGKKISNSNITCRLYFCNSCWFNY